MAIYTDKSEITDILITNHIQDQTEWNTWIETYLLRADMWYVERCLELGVDESDIMIYSDLVTNKVFTPIALLRYWVYIEVLTEFKANGLLDIDDYNSKIGGENGYKAMFDKYNNKLTSRLVVGEKPAINKFKRTGRRISLQADYYNGGDDCL